MADVWYTRPELARKLRVSQKTIQRRIRPTALVGRQNRYEWSDVCAQLQIENVIELRPSERKAA